MASPLKDIEAAKQKAVDLLNAKINSMSKEAYIILLSVIEDTFDVTGGRIVTGSNFVDQLNRLTVKVIDLIQNAPKFTGPVTQFVKRLTPLGDAVADYHKETNGVKIPKFETAKKIVIDEIIDRMLDNGLNQNFVQPLRDLIYQNATGGLLMRDARAILQETATGKLRRYIEQTSIQAVDSYTGMINVKVLQHFEMDAMQMTGSLIDNSSPQCRFVINELGGIITRSNWPKVRKIAERNGLVEGTTFDNLPLNLLHWECRHSFFPKVNAN